MPLIVVCAGMAQNSKSENPLQGICRTEGQDKDKGVIAMWCLRSPIPISKIWGDYSNLIKPDAKLGGKFIVYRIEVLITKIRLSFAVE